MYLHRALLTIIVMFVLCLSQGDGMSFPTKRIKSSLVHRITTPLRLGKDEVLSTITKLGGAVTFSAMSDAVITRMGANVIARKLNYQAALSLLCTKGVQSIRGRAAVQVMWLSAPQVCTVFKE